MQIVRKGNRKAISPVLATVILIAITLIAAIAIAGFVFGLFGTFTTTAQVQASVASCTNANGECQILLTNSGNSAATVVGCSFSGAGGGAGLAGSTKGPPPAGALPVVNANGGSNTLFCQNGAALGTGIGTQVTGAVQMSNGASVLFTGSWQ